MDLTTLIRAIPDFPEPGILFRDITPLLSTPEALRQVLDELETNARAVLPTAIVAIESRGFVFGAPLADRMRLPFVPIRKPGKLPSARMSVEYALEYGQGQLDIHADALGGSDRAYIVDDVLATGGTALAAVQLVTLLGATVAGLGFVVELAPLGGKALLAEYPVFASVTYR